MSVADINYTRTVYNVKDSVDDADDADDIKVAVKDSSVKATLLYFNPFRNSVKKGPLPGIAYVVLTVPGGNGGGSRCGSGDGKNAVVDMLEGAYNRVKCLESRFKIAVEKSKNQAVYCVPSGENVTEVKTNLTLGNRHDGVDTKFFALENTLDKNTDYILFLETLKNGGDANVVSDAVKPSVIAEKESSLANFLVAKREKEEAEKAAKSAKSAKKRSKGKQDEANSKREKTGKKKMKKKGGGDGAGDGGGRREKSKKKGGKKTEEERRKANVSSAVGGGEQKERMRIDPNAMRGGSGGGGRGNGRIV
jgi:hypothetical protein